MRRVSMSIATTSVSSEPLSVLGPSNTAVSIPAAAQATPQSAAPVRSSAIIKIPAGEILGFNGPQRQYHRS